VDPLAHTLVGASLAETRLKHMAPLAVPTLIVGANAPDIDALTLFVSGDVALGFRRGWTHGVLAMVALPALLAGLMMLVGRGLARRNPATAPRCVQLLPLACLSVWTHPALDWLNTYGIRLLMPFDGRWFYGDVLFIVDPWVWLLAATPVVLAHSRTPQSVGAWIVFGSTATLLIAGVGIPPALLLVWCGAVAGIAAARIWRGLQHRVPWLAVVMLMAISGYTLAMAAGSALARRQAAAWLAARDVTPLEIMAGPLPANPLVRDIVVVDMDHYHFLEVNWLANETVRIGSPAIARGPRSPIVEAALSAPHIQGLRTWMRFPSYQVDEVADGYRVTIRDVRYARLTTTGIGYGVVHLDRSLQPRSMGSE